MSLEVEPTFLAHVHEAMWQASDAEMRKLARRARGTYAMYHMGTRHGLNSSLGARLKLLDWWCQRAVASFCWMRLIVVS